MNKNISRILMTSAICGSLVLNAQVFAESEKTTQITAEKDIEEPIEKDFIEGYFESSKENIITIKDYDGTIHTKSFDLNSIMMVNERGAKVTDFKKGMEVYVKIDGERIAYMDSFTVDNPGYISPSSKQRVGVIKSIDRDQITIRTAIGTEETYSLTDATLTLKDGKNVSLNSLYAGDRVRLQFDDIETDFVSKLIIEGNSIKVKDLYRGKIAVTNRMSSVVSFGDVEVFRNGKWTKTDIIRLPYNSDLPLYLGGQKINYRNIEHYRGKTVYMAIKDSYGRDSAEKMVIKNKQEMTFSDKIENVNHFTSEIELSNKRNIGFNEGTMIIKSGRIVDSHSITPNSSALVVADGRGASATADVIYIYDEDVNNSNIGMDMIYAGRVDTIGEYTLNLKDFFVLNKNEWESFGSIKDGVKELYYDNDTFIYDADSGEVLDPEKLLNGEYNVDEDKAQEDYHKKLRDHYAYIYTDGDRIAGIYLRKNIDSVLRQKIVTATLDKNPLEQKQQGDDSNSTDTTLVEIDGIDEKEDGELTLALRDAKDWSAYDEGWKLKYKNLNVEAKGALVMKNGERIKTSELKKGDKIYMVMDEYMYGKTFMGRRARVIVVK